MGASVEDSAREFWNSSNVISRTERLKAMGAKPKEVDLDNLKKDFDDLPEQWKCFICENWMAAIAEEGDS